MICGKDRKNEIEMPVVRDRDFHNKLQCYFSVPYEERKEEGHREGNREVSLELWVLILKVLP